MVEPVKNLNTLEDPSEQENLKIEVDDLIESNVESVVDEQLSQLFS